MRNLIFESQAILKKVHVIFECYIRHYFFGVTVFISQYVGYWGKECEDMDSGFEWMCVDINQWMCECGLPEVLPVTKPIHQIVNIY